MRFRKAFVLLCAALTACTGITACADKGGKVTHDNGQSTMDFVREMGVGINLGNTFECCGSWISEKSVTNYETAWGSPIITQPMIQGYADAGFGTLRIPVAWSNMMSEDYTISAEYLSRVREVTDWALNAKLSVILNIHYDGGWWKDFAVAEKKDACMKKYTRIWEQICAEFQNTGYALMFESLNEEGCWDTLWNRYSDNQNGKSDAYALLNEINQKFVDTVRAGGGKNTERHLLIAGYAADIALTCDEAFRMPDDPFGHCAVSVHYYTPANFCVLEEDANWGKMQTEWGSESDRAELDRNLGLVKKTFLDKGIPVVMGEFGATKKHRTAEAVREYLTSVCKAACDRGICPVLWDTPGSFYDRDNAKMYDEALRTGLLAAAGKDVQQQDAA